MSEMNNTKGNSTSQWIAGILGAIIAGVIVYSLTEGIPPKIFELIGLTTDNSTTPDAQTEDPVPPSTPNPDNNPAPLQSAPNIFYIPNPSTPEVAPFTSPESPTVSVSESGCEKWNRGDSSGDDAYELGRDLYYDQEKYDQALQAWECVPQSNPNYSWAQRLIGYNIYCRQKGECEKGIPYLEAAYRVSPNDPKVLEDLGRAYIKVDREDEAIPILKKANTDIAEEALEKIGY